MRRERNKRDEKFSAKRMQSKDKSQNSTPIFMAQSKNCLIKENAEQRS